MKIDPVNIDLLFESSWEVCNKVGGIYTVLSTKALTLQSLYKDRVIFIGPDVWTAEKPCPCFTEVPSLLRPWSERAQLPAGVSFRVGRWNVPGKPIAILVKFEGMYQLKDYYYGEMWERYGVDSLHAYGDYDEACCFSLAAGAVIESLCTYRRLRHKNVLAHFNEWTTGMGLLYTRWKLPYVGTIFTTHATSIGRSICGNGKPLYDYLPGYNGDQMAGELNMQSKHSLEKAAAHAADCFTTVSDITATECEQLLDIRPQVVTPNGFQEALSPGKIKAKKVRDTSRASLLETAAKLAGTALPPETLIVATSGRQEYHNKGIDIFLDAIKKLQSEPKTGPTLALVLVPGWPKGPRKDLQEAATPAAGSTETKPLTDAAITHELNNPDSDPILGRIRQLGLDKPQTAESGAGTTSGRVQVIYIPVYLDGNDGIFNATYYDLLAGVDLTAFPSYYEPWGYTPLESVAFGIPTVTTSLSGFGQWVLSSGRQGFANSGVEVIQRTDTNYDEVVSGLTQAIGTIAGADEDRREVIARAAHSTASKAEWNYFITYYIDAFRRALAAADHRRNHATADKANTTKNTKA